MRDALSIFDRVVSFSGKDLTLQAVTENLNVLDYEVFFKATDAIINNDIPSLLIAFDEVLDKGFDGQHYVRGLASHFRDLLICKSAETQTLLEAGDQTREKYLSQSKKTDQQLLLEGIELANTCDLKYKSSQNQRLLVELCLMQLASITFSGEKKNNGSQIIPARIVRQSISNEAQDISSIKKTVVAADLKIEAQPPTDLSKNEPAFQPNQIILNTVQRRPSGLSIKSIEKKKAHDLKRIEVISFETENLPTEPFTEVDLCKYWDQYRPKIRR